MTKILLTNQLRRMMMKKKREDEDYERFACLQKDVLWSI